MFRVSLILLACFALCSCVVQPNKPLQIPLAGGSSGQATIVKTNRLQVSVPNRLPSPENLGGDDGYSNIEFQNIIPWLRAQLAPLSYPGCSLKHSIQLQVFIKKLYASNDSQTLVANVQLMGQYRVNQKIQSPVYYRGQCVTSFFSGNEKVGLRKCLSRAMQQILPKIKSDICRRAS